MYNSKMPNQVQGVFDDLQKKAVEYYKSSPVAKATSSVPGTKFGSSSSEGVATAMPDVVQTLETELEVGATSLFHVVSALPFVSEFGRPREFADLLP